MTRSNARERDGEGLLLAAATVEEALVADAPLRRAPGGDDGCQRAGMTPGPRAAFGEMLLPDKRPTLTGARVQARVGDDLVGPTEAHDVAQLGADGRRPLRANAGNTLQAPAVCIVA